MLQSDSDPIAAIATPPGRGAVGIVRVSGSDVSGVAKSVCGRSLTPRQATYLPFLDAFGKPIDHGLAVYFPAPHSYTGEDVLELQAHGGAIVLQLLLSRCMEAGKSIGMRLARPGEFTQRAFLNDKIDLAQAEAIADLLDASTEAAARGASRSLSGAFSVEIQALLNELTELRMLIEAAIDFPEEEVDGFNKEDAVGRFAALLATLDQVRQKARQGALLREGIKVVIAGQPNSGKSSLLNALAGFELAIVSPIAGTTRDKVQQTIQIDGVPLHVVDTAGLRHSDDEIEQMGVERAWAEIAAADVVLFLHDLTRLSQNGPAPWALTDRAEYMAADARIAARLAMRLPPSVPVVNVWNKIDATQYTPGTTSGCAVSISAKTGEGLDVLRGKLLQLVGWQSVPEGVYMARERHVQALNRVRWHLESAAAQLSGGAPQLDLLAEDLRLAQNALGEITGSFGSDDLLGEIFSRFCIGK